VPSIRSFACSAIGNRAVQRLLETNSRNCKGDLTTIETPHSGDFNPIPVPSSAPVGIQPKLTVGAPGDIYEQQADRVADMAMRVPDHETPRVGRDASNTPPLPSILAGQEKGVALKGIGDEDEPVEMPEAAEKCGCGEHNTRVDGKAFVQRSGGLGADASKLEPESATRIQATGGH
jgi:hypothetical protein